MEDMPPLFSCPVKSNECVQVRPKQWPGIPPPVPIPRLLRTQEMCYSLCASCPGLLDMVPDHAAYLPILFLTSSTFFVPCLCSPLIGQVPVPYKTVSTAWHRRPETIEWGHVEWACSVVVINTGYLSCVIVVVRLLFYVVLCGVVAVILKADLCHVMCCRRSVWLKIIWESQLFWMQRTWWLCLSQTDSASSHMSHNTIITSAAAHQVRLHLSTIRVLMK